MTTAALLIVIGRVVLGLFFVIAGIRNFLAFSDRCAMVTNYGFKLPAAATALGFLVQLLGGLALVTGLFTVWGAIALIVFLILATTFFHNFALFRGEEQQPHLYFTLVNCALVGYCLMVIATAA